jgi:hypothetical protein
LAGARPVGNVWPPDTFHVVVGHINRLYFADQTTLAVAGARHDRLLHQRPNF